MFWLYEAKDFSLEYRKRIFIKTFIRHYKRYLRFNFCIPLSQDLVNEIPISLLIKSLLPFTDNRLEISYHQFWGIGFDYITKTGLYYKDIFREVLTNPMFKLYIIDSDLKPYIKPLDWFKAKGYVSHRGQDYYHLWWLRVNCNGLTEEQRINKVINCVEQGYLPLELAGDYIFY